MYIILYNCAHNRLHFFKGFKIYIVSSLLFVHHSITNIAKDINVYFISLSVIPLIILVNTILSNKYITLVFVINSYTKILKCFILSTINLNFISLAEHQL